MICNQLFFRILIFIMSINIMNSELRTNKSHAETAKKSLKITKIRFSLRRVLTKEGYPKNKNFKCMFLVNFISFLGSVHILSGPGVAGFTSATRRENYHDTP